MLNPPQHGLDVEERGAVEGLQVLDPQPQADAARVGYPVQAYRVRASWGPGAEHARQRVGGVVARVHGEHVPVGPVEPGEQDDVGARASRPGPRTRRRRTKARRRAPPRALLGGGGRVDQGRLDPADRPQLVPGQRMMGFLSGEPVSATQTSRTVNCSGLVTPVTKAWLVSRIEPLASKAMLAGES